MMMWPLLQGFGLGASMIIPIGAQNAYVLNQGIRRQHHLATATTCLLCDIALICTGIFGGGAVIASNQLLLMLMSWGGILFLSWYGYSSFRSAWKATDEGQDDITSALKTSRRSVVVGALAVTLLNPHVYLDTVVILGSLGGQYAGDERIAFAVGTLAASFVWFYGLSAGAARLAPWLGQLHVRRWIDVLVGTMMWFIAFKLLMGVI
ncbi:LysE/ArgO family amino acid transporter [Spongorhabdus nitratireducens]